MNIRLVLPSAKISGGNRELLRLAEELAQRGCDVSILCMWDSPHSMSSVTPIELLSKWRPSVAVSLFQLPFMLLKFHSWRRSLRRLTREQGVRFVFTHYITLPLSLLVPRTERSVYVQDLEWKFVGNPLLSALLRVLILYCYRRARVVTANSYLTKALQAEGLSVEAELPVWADGAFLSSTAQARDIDFVMVLRKGAHKRLDLYLQFLDRARRDAGCRAAVITPEDEIGRAVKDRGDVILLRPTLEQMRSMYGRSKCFVHLSDHEGFGLPPLEAMAAGCVPICRDSGGVRAFVGTGELSPLLLPASTNIDEVYRVARALTQDAARLDSLSAAVRRVFREGLRSAADRSAALHVFMNHVASHTQ